MAQPAAIRMSRPARLGLIALVCIIVISLGTYAGIKMVRGTGGYQMGVHFRTAAGVAPGAQVYFSGVNIGAVSKVRILPDTTVDMILNISRPTDIPKNAAFSVLSSFTGSPTITIMVPTQRVAHTSAPTPLPQSDIWPKRILPVAEQPVGSTPLSIEDVMAEGRALTDRADRALAQARPYGPRMLRHVQNARTNGAATTQEMRTALPAMQASLHSTIARAQANAASAQRALLERDQPMLAAVASAFSRSSRDMKQAANALTSVGNDPRARANVRAAAANLRDAASRMAQLSGDMEIMTQSPQTKAELRDAGDRFHEIMAHLKSRIP
ncbi:MAG TPA: MlaD family protein [Candidatus Baltobacteraceae bacterium]|nr:MlaD family protein [Candidatus Baltobacteraceae bacterium]